MPEGRAIITSLLSLSTILTELISALTFVSFKTTQKIVPKKAIKIISAQYLNLQIKNDDTGNFKQYYIDIDVNIDSFDVSNENLNDFIKDYLDKPFDDVVIEKIEIAEF